MSWRNELKELTDIKQIKPGDFVYSFTYEYSDYDATMVFIFLGFDCKGDKTELKIRQSKNPSYSKNDYYYDIAGARCSNSILYPLFEFHSYDITNNRVTKEMWKQEARNAMDNFNVNKVVYIDSFRSFVQHAYFTTGIGLSKYEKMLTHVHAYTKNTFIRGNESINPNILIEWTNIFNTNIKSNESNSPNEYNLAYKLNNKTKYLDIFLCLGIKGGNWHFSHVCTFSPDTLISIYKFMPNFALPSFFEIGVCNHLNDYTDNKLKPLNLSCRPFVEEKMRTDATVREILQQYN